MQFAVAAWARVRTGAAQRRTGADRRGYPLPQGGKVWVSPPSDRASSFVRIFSPTQNAGFIRQGRGPLPPKTLSVPELGDRGGGLTKPRPRAHEKILPHTVTHPRPPIGVNGVGCLQLGGEPRSHTAANFFGRKSTRRLALCAHRRAQDAGISRGRNARPPHAAAILAAFTGSAAGQRE